MNRRVYIVNLTTYIFALLFFVSTSPGMAAETQEPLLLGVHPYLAASDLYKRFSPLARYLSKEIGRPINIKIAKDYKEHIDEIGQDKLDIAYMGPASYVRLVDAYGKKHNLARLEINGKPTFQGIFIIRKESRMSRLEDLAGKRFAFGDPNSTMSHLVPRFMMREEGVSVDKLGGYAHLSNHHNVAMGVIAGDFDSGAVKEEIFYQYEKRGLKVLARTTPISEHIFVASNKLPQETVKKLREALYKLKDSKEGKTIMTAIKKNMTNMVPASDEDYDNLRNILKTLDRIGVKP